jgi:hypothetical protein
LAMPDDKPIPDPFEPDDSTSSSDSNSRSFMADAVRKAVLAGVGALFVTEEGARKLAREWKLPKDLIGFAASQAEGARGELLRVFSEEFRRFLESETFRQEIRKALSSMAVEVKAEIRFKGSKTGEPKIEVDTAIMQPPSDSNGEGDPR